MGDGIYRALAGTQPVADVVEKSRFIVMTSDAYGIPVLRESGTRQSVTMLSDHVPDFRATHHDPHAANEALFEIVERAQQRRTYLTNRMRMHDVLHTGTLNNKLVDRIRMNHRRQEAIRDDGVAERAILETEIRCAEEAIRMSKVVNATYFGRYAHTVHETARNDHLERVGPWKNPNYAPVGSDIEHTVALALFAAGRGTVAVVSNNHAARHLLRTLAPYIGVQGNVTLLTTFWSDAPLGNMHSEQN